MFIIVRIGIFYWSLHQYKDEISNFMWVWCKNLYNEYLASQWRIISNSRVQFFTKMGKLLDMGFEVSYKDGLCPKH